MAKIGRKRTGPFLARDANAEAISADIEGAKREDIPFQVRLHLKRHGVNEAT